MSHSRYKEQCFEALNQITRRHFLKTSSIGLGAAAMSLIGCASESARQAPKLTPSALRDTHFAPRARNVIFLHMAGAPSQLELYDYKPDLHRLNG